MTPIFLAQIAIDSIELGLAYGLLSVGLSLVFGVLDVLNCAHGALYMIGGYFAFTTVYSAGLPPWAGVLAATGGCFFLGILIELVAVERVRGDPNTAIIMTVGIAYLLEQVALLKWGGVFQSISPLLNGEIQFAGLYASWQQTLGALVAITISFLISQFMLRSRLGKAIRMIAYDRESTVILGINVSLIAMLTFGIGAATAGLSGALLAPIYSLYPSIGWNILVYALVVVTLGGVGSVKGTLVAGILYALAQNIAAIYISQYNIIVGLAILIIVLSVRPAGLFGKTLIERA